MDYDVIKKHLLYHNFDPFNREESALEKLNEYNNMNEIIEKNKLFKIRIKMEKKY